MLLYKLPLNRLPEADAKQLIEKLYHPDERFAQGYLKYRMDVLGLPKEEAWESTQKELRENIDHWLSNLTDPQMHTVGMLDGDVYTPVGLYGFRELKEHKKGVTLLGVIREQNLASELQGKLGICHSLSILDAYRSLTSLRCMFLFVATEAIEKNYDHIFFYMSDHRLKGIYERFGLVFPENLRFPDTKHLVGYYSLTPENLETIRQEMDAQNFQELIKLVS
ncbi:MAG: hypothetical protein KTR14_02315 [Vampirovibrio sp.]|nr:hypothetical protein [Vampirovibrio sp.]